VESVSLSDISTENRVSGTVAADNEHIIMVAGTAKCTAVHAQAGDTVQAGDILCTLDMGSTLANYSAATIGYQAALQAYESQKAILDKQIALAEDNVNNTKALFAIGAASQLEIDSAELALQQALAGRDSALAQLEAGIQSGKAGVEQLAMVMENVDSKGNIPTHSVHKRNPSHNSPQLPHNKRKSTPPRMMTAYCSRRVTMPVGRSPSRSSKRCGRIGSPPSASTTTSLKW
jgi:hypothetical protein